MVVCVQLPPVFRVGHQTIDNLLTTHFFIQPRVIAGPAQILARHSAHRKIIYRIPWSNARTCQIFSAEMLVDIQLHPRFDHAAQDERI